MSHCNALQSSIRGSASAQCYTIFGVLYCAVLHAGDSSTGAEAHDVLAVTGGSIGIGLPLALGAAVACPERRVVALQADGSAMYTVQALWTMAREKLPVVVVLLANRRYGIFSTEMSRLGLTPDIGPTSERMIELDGPYLDFSAMAQVRDATIAQSVMSIGSDQDAFWQHLQVIDLCETQRETDVAASGFCSQRINFPIALVKQIDSAICWRFKLRDMAYERRARRQRQNWLSSCRTRSSAQRARA